MQINDIREDLDKDIFLGNSRKDILVSKKTSNKDNTLNEIFQDINSDILLSGNNSLKISQKYRFFSKKPKHYFDPIYKSRFTKKINLQKQKYFDLSKYLKKLEELKCKYSSSDIKKGFRNFYTQIPLNTTIQQKSHNFIKKELGYSNIKKQNITTNKYSIFIGEILNNLKTHWNLLSDKINNINNYKKFSIIILLIFITVFGLKISIEENVNNGYSQLVNLKNGNLGGKSIEDNFEEIYESFQIADILYKPISLIPNETIDNGYHVIKGGKQIGYFGKYFLEFYNNIQNNINNSGIENIYISEFLEQNRELFYDFEKSLSQAILHYNQVTNVGDTQLQKTFDDTIVKLKKSVGLLKTININFEEFLGLMGHNEKKDYLIVFQNNDEIRPTGGFMGSMGIISIYKGKVLEIRKSDVYAYEWEINKTYNSIAEKTLAPEGLNQITGTWGLRDSNYYPEVKQSAGEIKGFLDRINENIDGVIFINKSTIEEILRVSGGIQFDAIGEKLTDENFSRVMSTLVEAKVSKEGTLGTPKQVLFDFAESFYQEMKNNDDYIPYSKVIYNHLLSRDIMIYSFDSSQNSLLWKLGLNGELPFYKTLDFAYPVYTSISGNKSGRYIDTQYEKIVTELGQCNYSTNLDIIRKHTFNQTEEIKVNALLEKFDIENKEHILYIQGKGDNYQYMRVLLPKTAIITPQENMIITKYPRYQEVSFYMKTRLYESTKYSINYSIKNENCNGYSYKLFKQPGIKEYKMSLNIFGENIFAREVQKDFYIKR